MNPDWDGVMKAKARAPKENPVAPRVPAEGPAENLRNALAVLGAAQGALSVLPTRNPPAAGEVYGLLEAVSQRIWTAIQQIEGTPQ